MKIIGFLLCLFGRHIPMCSAPTDEQGNYIEYPQNWSCRRGCSARWKEYRVAPAKKTKGQPPQKDNLI